MDENPPTRLLKTRPDLVVVPQGDELLVLDPGTGGLHQFDRIASLIWPFLDGTATTLELADDLATAFGVDRELVAGQMEQLVQRLRGNALLEGSEGSPETSDPGANGYGYLVDPPSP